jgi:5-methylcytosine-specific restriction endonuclease McrA
MKICKNCGSSEYYSCGVCKPCAQARNAAWYADNIEKRRASIAAWRSSNLEMDKAQKAAWYSANHEKVKANSVAWRAVNHERKKTTDAAWSAANLDVRRERQQNRRARKRANGGKLSAGLTEKLFRLQRGKCACCGKPLGDDYHLDHRMPLALGGANDDSNMQLLTAKCNLQKQAKHPIDFMQSRGFLL